MTRASDAHPYCAVVVTIVPLDAEGRPDLRGTVTVSGVGGPIGIEPGEITIEWQPDRHGTRCTISGSREWI